MLREVVYESAAGRVILLDSISQVTEEDRGQVVVAGSNGGLAAGEEGLRVGCCCVVLNDAGVGKDEAGLAGIRALDQGAIPALAVSHESAEISDGRDMWENGVISFVNQSAAAAGFRTDVSVKDAILTYLGDGGDR